MQEVLQEQCFQENLEKLSAVQNAKNINEQILVWFRNAWIKSDEKNQEKQQFYDWLSENYKYHMKAHKENKKEYFDSEGKINHKDAILSVLSGIMTAGAGIVGIIQGIFSENMPDFKWNEIFDYVVNLLRIIGTWIVIALVLLAFMLICSFMVNNVFLKKMSDLRQYRETWLRHGKVIQRYQEELLGYILCINDYAELAEGEARDQLLMERVKSVWLENYKLFEHNMLAKSKENEKTRMKKYLEKLIKSNKN